MKTITSESGKKRVHIRKNGDGFVAMFVQVFIEFDQEREQVLESKKALRESTLIKWANSLV